MSRRYQPICPECRAGKHPNCTVEVLDPDNDDDYVSCACTDPDCLANRSSV